MGRGDKKTKKGKLFMGSFGVSRPRKAAGYVAPTTPAAPKTPKVAAEAVAAAPKAAKPKASAKPKE
jgi:30S ribosomal protein S31